MMSKAKWFAVRKPPSTGGIIAKSANQIVPPKFRGGTKILYYIHQTPLSSWRVEGGSGDETSLMHDPSIISGCGLRLYIDYIMKCDILLSVETLGMD